MLLLVLLLPVLLPSVCMCLNDNGFGLWINALHKNSKLVASNADNTTSYWSWSGDEMWTSKHPHTFLSWIAQSHFWASKMRLRCPAQKWVGVFPSPHLIPRPWYVTEHELLLFLWAWEGVPAHVHLIKLYKRVSLNTFEVLDSSAS